MKIAVQSQRSSYYQGGAERYALDMILELQNLFTNITFISYDAPRKSEWFKNFVKKFKGDLILVKSKDLDRRFKIFKEATEPELWDKESILFSKESKKVYQNNKFDIIILHYSIDCLGVPRNQNICLHLHGLPDYKRRIENKAIKIPNKIIAVSNYVGEGWQRLYNIKKKIFVVHNGINFNQKSYNKKNKRNDILFFGRLIKIKGVNILLESIEILSKEFKDLKVKIIGEGPEKKNLIKFSKKLKIEKDVKFLGRVNDDTLRKTIADSKISVFPSYSREGVMTTLLEASLMKSSIIAADACSNPEFIKNGVNGLLFESKNAQHLAKQIKKLLIDEELRRRLIKKAYKKVKNWSWENQTKRLTKIYKE